MAGSDGRTPATQTLSQQPSASPGNTVPPPPPAVPAPPTAPKGSRYLANPADKTSLHIHGVRDPPSDFLPLIRRDGFLLFTLDSDPFPWDDVSKLRFCLAFRSRYVHAEQYNERGYIGYARAPASFSKCRTYVLIRNFLFQRAGYELFGSTNVKGEISWDVYKFHKSLIMGSDLVDLYRNIKGTGIHGYRIVAFDQPTTVLVHIHQGDADTFAAQRKLYWDDLLALTDGAFVYGPGVSEKTSGTSVSIRLEPNQFLILPAPASFLPIVNCAELYMVTAFMYRRPPGSPTPPSSSTPNLGVAYLASVLRTPFPGSDASYYDAHPASRNHIKSIEASVAGVQPLNARRHTFYQPSGEKAVVYPSADELLSLLKNPTNRNSWGLGTVDLTPVKHFMKLPTTGEDDVVMTDVGGTPSGVVEDVVSTAEKAPPVPDEEILAVTAGGKKKPSKKGSTQARAKRKPSQAGVSKPGRKKKSS